MLPVIRKLQSGKLGLEKPFLFMTDIVWLQATSLVAIWSMLKDWYRKAQPQNLYAYLHLWELLKFNGKFIFYLKLLSLQSFTYVILYIHSIVIICSNQHLPSLNSWRSLGWTNSGLTVSNHQKSSAMNTITLCCKRSTKNMLKRTDTDRSLIIVKTRKQEWKNGNPPSNKKKKKQLYFKCLLKQCLYLEHQWRIEHVLCSQIETFIQIFIGKLSQ